jgi:hypothetical protein
MSKRLLMAVMIVGLIAAPAFASVQSVKVSGTLQSTWLIRDSFDLGKNQNNGFAQNLLITQALVRFDADLTDNVGVTTELINERVWGGNNTTQYTDSNGVSGGDTVLVNNNGTNEVDINQAYLTLKEFLNSNVTMYVGRQTLNYGNGFIIGDGGPNNSVDSGGLKGAAEDLTWRTKYDAVRAVFDYNPLVVDLVYSKVNKYTLTGAGEPKSDVDLYGINANWSLGDSRNSGIETYFWAKMDNCNYTTTATTQMCGALTQTGFKSDTVYVPGFRVYSNPIEGLYTSAEVAWQRGTTTSGSTAPNIQREAMGAQVIGSYAIPGDTLKQYAPVITGSYTYVSGDSNSPQTVTSPKEEKNTAWDPMFESQGGGTIYNTLFNLSDAQIYSAALQVTPMQDVIAKVTWWGLWLDKNLPSGTSTTSINQPDGATVSELVNPDKTSLGNEVDVDLMFNYTEDVQLGFSAGWFFPGGVFAEGNTDSAKQFLTKATVNW